MAKEMLINVSEGEECRIALVEKGRLEELYMERTSSTSHVGNIYKGRVTNVEPSIQAAFIDFGLGRNGFLHISDLMPTYFGRAGEDIKESVGRKMARRDRPPIQRCLRRGDEIIVQIIKEGIGTKGPTLSTYLSIPGRILVMMPGMSKLGVSRKIEDEEERRRLRRILDELKPPRDCGFIIRTAGVGKSKADIQKDLTYLTRLWQNIDKKIKNVPPPVELYTEGDLVTRTVRDVFTNDVERIVVDNEEVAERVRDFIKIAMPRTKNKVEYHDGPVPLFHDFGIEREIELMYSRHVPLPSGGSLVIDSTEAIVAIDVNSGKFRDHSDAEMTAFKTDMEAADEIARQLRLRDLGGVIICDFIDLRYERHRRDLEKRLHDHLKHDRAKTKMLRMSQFGIIEMTRQRMRPSLKRSVYFDCPHCKGAGLVKTPESMALDVMRRLAIAMNDQRVQRVELGVASDVAFYLQNRKRAGIARLEEHFRKRVVVHSDLTLAMDAMRLDLYDSRDGLVFLEELGMAPPVGQPGAPVQGRAPQAPQAQPQRGGRDSGRRDDRRPDGRSQQRDQRTGQRDQRPSERGPEQRRDHRERGRDRDQREDRIDRREFEEVDDRFDIDRVEEAVERREEQIEADVAESAGVIAPPPAPIEASSADSVGDEDRALVEAGDNGEMVSHEERFDRPQASEETGGEPRGQGYGSMAEARGRRGRGRGRGGEEARRAAAQPIQQEQPSKSAKLEPAEQADEFAGESTAAAEPQKPKKRTRRGSRGGRRGRAAEAAGGDAVSTGEPAPYQEATEASAPSSEAAPAPKRRRRGSRGGRGRKKSPAAVPESAAASASEPAPPAPVSAVVERPILTRTGSTDRHLMRDEPVLPPPVSRPRTYRDLDHIPDDLD
jgi:ribonuclease E